MKVIWPHSWDYQRAKRVAAQIKELENDPRGTPPESPFVRRPSRPDNTGFVEMIRVTQPKVLGLDDA